MRAPARLAVVTLALVVLVPGEIPRAAPQAADTATALTLTATAHPPLPEASADLWIAPPPAPASPLSRGVEALAGGRPDAALALLAAPAPDPALTGYQQYYRALALTRAGRAADAAPILAALTRDLPRGALGDMVRLAAGEAAEAAGNHREALEHYEALGRGTTAAPDDLLLRLGRVRLALGDRRGAVAAYQRLHDTFPLSEVAPQAASELAGLDAWAPLEHGSERFAKELARAERLFAARRYAQARDAFEVLLPASRGDDHELVSLRLAECDHYLKRHRAAREALTPWLDKARRRAEARFFHLTATRELGERAEYVRLAEALIAEFPEETWAEEALNNLATHYILVDEDAKADAVFRQVLERFPLGRHAPRAAWRVGWNAYRQGRHAETAEVFELAASRFPRSDYRPPWIYWAARSRDQLGDVRVANRLYGILVADYLNSYYGRLASRQLTAREVEPMTMARAVAAPPGSLGNREAARSPAGGATTPIIRALIAHGLYDAALAEVRWAQQVSGDSPALQATVGLIYSRRGELRRGITAIRRAYPQFMTAGGEDLPVELLEVLFPVAYWELIQKHAPARGLDPYLVAALMAQESTFDRAIRSSANAIGLMQVLPSTGRRYARQLKIPRFSAARLTDPEVNVRIGTAYFADMVRRFGGVHHALASYNAGPGRVARWIAEKPGVDTDEFIDDIPFPETQNYVKRILGTAEDYRRLYRHGGGRLVMGPPGSEARAVQPPARRPAGRKPPVPRTTPKAR